MSAEYAKKESIGSLLDIAEIRIGGNGLSKWERRGWSDLFQLSRRKDSRDTG